MKLESLNEDCWKLFEPYGMLYHAHVAFNRRKNTVPIYSYKPILMSTIIVTILPLLPSSINKALWWCYQAAE